MLALGPAQRHADARGAAAVELGDGEGATVDDDALAHLGEPAEIGHDEAGHGLVRPLGQLEADLVREVLDVEQAVDLDLAADALLGPLLDVVLVADVADELLDEVLERHDARGAAVLVDDDGEVGAGRPHLEHRRQHALAAREHEDLAGELGDADAAVG